MTTKNVSRHGPRFPGVQIHPPSFNPPGPYIWSPPFNQRLSKIFVHTVESAEGLPSLPVDVLIHQGASAKAQVRWTEIFHLSLTLSSSTWALHCKSFATVTNKSWHRAEVWSVQETLHLILNVWFWEALGTPVFQTEIRDSNEGRKEGRRTKNQREGEEKKQRGYLVYLSHLRK